MDEVYASHYQFT